MYVLLNFLFFFFFFSDNMFYKSICSRSIGNKMGPSLHTTYAFVSSASGQAPDQSYWLACLHCLTPLQSTSHPVATVIFLKGKSNFMSIVGKVLSCFLLALRKPSNSSAVIPLSWSLCPCPALWLLACGWTLEHPRGLWITWWGTGYPFAWNAFAPVSHSPNWLICKKSSFPKSFLWKSRKPLGVWLTMGKWASLAWTQIWEAGK